MHIAVSACMCLYHAFLCSVSCAYVSVCQKYSTHIRADIYRYALSGGVHICMYLTVFLYGIHAHMHSCIQCISACICLYFDPEYDQICISIPQYMRICTRLFSAHLYVFACISNICKPGFLFFAPNGPPADTQVSARCKS
jgi:hypothetical protein